jgi:hypothetical protein
MDIVEYDSWIVTTLSNWFSVYPELAEGFIFEKVIYWKLLSSHNVVIKRDQKFFNNILPILENTWNQVLYYRDNIDKLDDLKKIIEKRKKYKKFNTEIIINNDDLIKNKIKFLYENTNKIELNCKHDNIKNLNCEYENCNFID